MKEKTRFNLIVLFFVVFTILGFTVISISINDVFNKVSEKPEVQHVIEKVDKAYNYMISE